jgi:hypothetical protein
MTPIASFGHSGIRTRAKLSSIGSIRPIQTDSIKELAYGLLRYPTMNNTESVGEDRFNMGRGVMGALLGAAIGVGAMFAFYALAGFRFPLLGVGIGILTGFCAKKFFKGGDTTLGFISAGIALVAVVATLFLMYGTFPMMSIISVIVSATVAYRIASS